MVDKMVMTRRESVQWETKAFRVVGDPEIPASQKKVYFRNEQKQVAQEYADRTLHTVELYSTEADGTETLILTVEPAAT